MILIRLLLIFGVGYVTWYLALVRTYALIARQKWLLCSLIFIEETVMLTIGIWLARQGTISDILACATGGTFAAYILIRKKEHGCCSRI